MMPIQMASRYFSANHTAKTNSQMRPRWRYLTNSTDDDRSSHARFADRRESIGISMRRLSPVALSNE
jgi:hypothetical protein